MQHTANSLTYAEAGEVARLGPRRPGEVDLGYEACGVGHWIGARSRGDRAASGSAGMERKRGCWNQVSRVWWKGADSASVPRGDGLRCILLSYVSVNSYHFFY